jgi:hypothetical protein
MSSRQALCVVGELAARTKTTRKTIESESRKTVPLNCHSGQNNPNRHNWTERILVTYAGEIVQRQSSSRHGWFKRHPSRHRPPTCGGGRLRGLHLFSSPEKALELVREIESAGGKALLSVYSMTKAALVGLVRGAAIDLDPARYERLNQLCER